MYLSVRLFRLLFLTFSVTEKTKRNLYTRLMGSENVGDALYRCLGSRWCCVDFFHNAFPDLVSFPTL